MSHIYQPLLIRSLLDAGGSATVRQLATAFLIEDESQLLYYEKRIKQMPVRVLKSHGVVERNAELVCHGNCRRGFAATPAAPALTLLADTRSVSCPGNTTRGID